MDSVSTCHSIFWLFDVVLIQTFISTPPHPDHNPSHLTAWDPFSTEAASGSKHLTPHLTPKGKKANLSSPKEPIDPKGF